MNHWTEKAKAKLENYFAGLRQKLMTSGADVREVTEDLRRHIEEEAASRKLAVVTEQDLEQILAQIGPPEAVGTPSGQPALSAASPGQAAVRKRPGWWLLVLGVVLPLGTVVFELLTGACAGVFFDPLPSTVHVVLAAFVPLANLWVWLASRSGNPGEGARLAWVNAIALGISSLYALAFVPLAPFAAIGILFYGFGLVPLAPLFSCAAAIRLRLLLVETAGDRVPPRWWPGFAAGATVLILVTLPSLLTSWGLQMAIGDSPAERTRGVRWLRQVGQREDLLRACYGRSGRAAGLYSWGKRVGAEDARAVYYRVYGEAFNSVPPPRLYAGRARWDLIEQEFTWDDDQGGDAVAGRVRGLSLYASRQDAMVDAAGAWAYVEWTLEFKNESVLQREARAQLLLPPGGVVSRLTLWIDGEEREAAFGGCGQVKAAYKRVVARRRDPVLVTTAGPDRVLMQCFPVPPNGGRMKLRLGITAPLALMAPDDGRLRWPCFVERNFTIPEAFTHSLWVESSQALDSPRGKLKSSPTRAGSFSLCGKLADPDMALPGNSVRVWRPAGAVRAWTSHTREKEGEVILQSIRERPVSAPDRVVVVVDGTRGMETNFAAISRALRRLPANLGFALLVARDGVEERIPLQQGTPEIYGRAALGRTPGRGGHDNVPALLRGWELASEAANSAIVWVHGPQPVLLETAEELKQHLERSLNPPLLFTVQARPGPNRVLEMLDGLGGVRPVLRVGDLEEDLGRLFGGWAEGARDLEIARQKIDSAPSGTDAESATLHLARLWAADEVKRLREARRIADAVEVAMRYQLVTPVTGAVVLETQQQYREAGLEPVAPDTVPSVPEPSSPLLVLLGLTLVAAWRRLARQSSGACTAAAGWTTGDSLLSGCAPRPGGEKRWRTTAVQDPARDSTPLRKSARP